LGRADCDCPGGRRPRLLPQFQNEAAKLAAKGGGGIITVSTAVVGLSDLESSVRVNGTITAQNFTALLPRAFREAAATIIAAAMAADVAAAAVAGEVVVEEVVAVAAEAMPRP